MHFTRKLMGVLICFGIVTTISAAASDDSSEVISVVNGVKITRGDLEKKAGNRLLQAKYDYYSAQRKALDQVIDEQLVEAEAARQHLTVDQLLEKAVKPVADPSDEALQIYYSGLKTDEPFEAYKQKIRDHVKATMLNRERMEYIRSLRDKASVRIDLMPPSADVNLDDAFLNGSKTAPVVLVEFADYECPYCAKVYPQIQKLKEEFGDKVTIAFRDFPLSIHKNAQKAAEASRCAGQQGKYWEYHDLLFTGRQLDVAQLKSQARDLKLDGAKFDACLDSGSQADAIKKDVSEGMRLGLTGTPSFFLNGHFFSGTVEYSTLRGLVVQQLAEVASTPKQISQK